MPILRGICRAPVVWLVPCVERELHRISVTSLMLLFLFRLLDFYHFLYFIIRLFLIQNYITIILHFQKLDSNCTIWIIIIKKTSGLGTQILCNSHSCILSWFANNEKNWQENYCWNTCIIFMKRQINVFFKI